MYLKIEGRHLFPDSNSRQRFLGSNADSNMGMSRIEI